MTQALLSGNIEALLFKKENNVMHVMHNGNECTSCITLLWYLPVCPAKQRQVRFGTSSRGFFQGLYRYIYIYILEAGGR